MNYQFSVREDCARLFSRMSRYNKLKCLNIQKTAKLCHHMTFSTQKLRACNWYSKNNQQTAFTAETLVCDKDMHIMKLPYHKKSKSAPDHIAGICNLTSHSHINGIKKVHGTENHGSKLITAAGLKARNKRVDKMSEEKTKISVI